MDILKIIEKQHPECAASVFVDYGYGDWEVTAENIKALCQKHGPAFAAAITTAITNKINEDAS